LTRLVYKGGEHFYDRLYTHINNEDYSLQEALKVVYSCDRKRIREASIDGLKTYTSQYSGFQLFDIFE
jgi:hypothetical protein